MNPGIGNVGVEIKFHRSLGIGRLDALRRLSVDGVSSLPCQRLELDRNLGLVLLKFVMKNAGGRVLKE